MTFFFSDWLCLKVYLSSRQHTKAHQKLSVHFRGKPVDLEGTNQTDARRDVPRIYCFRLIQSGRLEVSYLSQVASLEGSLICRLF